MSVFRRSAGYWACALLVCSATVGCKKRVQETPSSEPPPSVAVTSAVVDVPARRLAFANTGTTGTLGSTQTPSAVAPGVEAPGTSTVNPRTAVKHAVIVSVDGLAPRFLEVLLEGGKAPNFAALQKQAAWTHNARTDKTYTTTLPNHTCMITGLPVSPTRKFGPHFAHGWVENTDPMPDDTLHRHRTPAGTYTSSMFDVAHDNGMRTALFASKTKFSLYAQTYNDAGGVDKVGADNGRQKIDTVVIDVDPATMVDSFIALLQSNPPALSFVHLNQPDGSGHGSGWGSPAYLTAVSQMDVLLGKIVAALQAPTFLGEAALIVTSDHGGVDVHHADQSDMRNFQIPFYVWAPGVTPGDVYRVFTHRFDPGKSNPAYEDEKQPLRNCDAGNLAVSLLGLDPIPESVVHSAGLQLLQ
jgi:hypothetical protein